jgi:TolB-like protein/DNA-binding winged helix-turn-helix (wHTH) protein/Tfp pilus assembly protein PilF
LSHVDRLKNLRRTHEGARIVDIQADAASKAGTSPQNEGRGAFAFAGLVLDLDACILQRESGEAIALTRGEFALLREFVRRPGRVLSRDFLLDAAVGRRNVPFDRSIDVMVGRLRKKVEPDPKHPSVIQTVSGEGYRFTTPLAPRKRAAEAVIATTAGSPGDTATPPPSASPQTWRALWPILAAAVALCLIAAAAAIQWRAVPQKAPRLSIVVLPFENMSGDREQDYFADGITDDLTTDLSHLQDSFVISRGTAFTYKGKPVDAKEIGRELGVRYLLEGSVRRLGENVEVNAQLISTETGAHVWADRFQGERRALGELQVDVVSRLANSLGVELVKAEALRSMRERPNNLDAVDLAMRATAKANSGVSAKAGNNDVIDLCERALALDPQNERAMVELANALFIRVLLFWSDDPAGDAARAEKVADSALALRPDDAWAHLAKSNVFVAKRQWGAAIPQIEAAITLDPNNASAHARASYYRMFLGRSEEGFLGVETALRLSPRDPSVSYWQFYMCQLHTQLAQWEQAIEWCGKSIAGNPQYLFAYVDLAAANAWAGHDKEAKEAAAQLRQLNSNFTVRTWAGIHWSDDPTFKDQYAPSSRACAKQGCRRVTKRQIERRSRKQGWD